MQQGIALEADLGNQQLLLWHDLPIVSTLRLYLEGCATQLLLSIAEDKKADSTT